MLLAAMRATVEELAAGESHGDIAVALDGAVQRLEQATDWVLAAAERDPEEIGAAGVDYQWVFGLTLLAWTWARLVLASAGAADSSAGTHTLAAGKVNLARFFMSRVLPAAEAHFLKMQAGNAPIAAPADRWFPEY